MVYDDDMNIKPFNKEKIIRLRPLEEDGSARTYASIIKHDKSRLRSVFYCINVSPGIRGVRSVEALNELIDNCSCDLRGLVFYCATDPMTSEWVAVSDTCKKCDCEVLRFNGVGDIEAGIKAELMTMIGFTDKNTLICEKLKI